MTHWAAHLIGRPYKSGQSGPDEFDCIGLVRHYFEDRYNLLLPDYHVTDGTTKLLAFARATGWRRVPGQPANDDLMLMDNHIGRHIGVVVECSEGLGLLHAQGDDIRGSVVWQPLDTLFGYRNKEFWRKIACS